MGSTDDCLLKAKLLLYPKKTKAEVKLTTNSVIIETPSGPEVIDLNDVTGCHITSGNNTTCAKWHICIFFYPLKKKIFKGLVRHKMSRSFGFKCEPTEEENLELAKKWKRVIQHLISGSNVNSDNVDNLDDPTPRHLLVYVNPFSGQAKASEMYKNFVKPMFAEADIKHTMVKTEYAGHARKLVKDLDLTKYDGIVIVSGDGLVHEVINGLMDRSDWQTAIKTPLGIVPGGSGNALAAAIVYASTGLHPLKSLVVSCLFEICRGQTKLLDLLEVQTHDTQNENESITQYSVLGFVIGLIADIDIESEKLRFLGGALRSNIYAVMRVATKRNYNITLSYLPTSEPDNGQLLCNKASGDANISRDGIQKKPGLKNFLPPLSEAVPETWETVESQSVQISGILLSHIGGEFLMHPQSEPGDGEINLTQIKSSVTRMELLNNWGKMEDGSGIPQDQENLRVSQCRAFRVEPKTLHSQIMTIDGERLPYGAIQCQVHKKLARVYGSFVEKNEV